MLIQNITKKTLVAKRAIEATSLLEKSFGLLLHRKAVPMVFRTRFGIHTFFMRYPIDVVILNRSYQVMDLRENVKPWSIFLWNPRYDFVLELPEGTILATKTKLHDIFLFR